MNRRSLTLVGLILLASTPALSQVVCASKPGGRQACPLDTSSGVTIVRSTGTAVCLLGKNWGYDDAHVWVSGGCSGEFSSGRPVSKHFGSYTPGVGFKVADTEQGTLNIKLFTYVRYLNQRQLDGIFTDFFGKTSEVKQRQDFQVNKVLIYFLGWFLSPKFRYLAYVWSTNVSQGLAAQVVVAGNLTYTFNDHFTLGLGINSLPGVRSTEGNFPNWLLVDSRPIADEFFRPSYTTGIFADGFIVHGLNYSVMLGNNLSQLGIDAGQLDNGLNTVSTALVWMPTTGEFGKRSAYGDFEDHQKLATRLGAHYTHSQENSQSQPLTDNFDNVQIRLSDGNVIFQPDLFGPGITVTDVTYRMTAFDAGLKYRGFSLDGEFYRRWLNHFRGPGTTTLAPVNDHGFQVQASAMLIPKTLHPFAAGSRIFGDYGNPWDLHAGFNWYPWKTEGIRVNLEYIQLHRSPVGALSLPYPVGGNGPTFNANLMVTF